MGAQLVFPGGPPEVFAQNAGCGRKGARMGFTACRAVAVRDRHVELVNRVPDGPTQAASIQ